MTSPRINAAFGLLGRLSALGLVILAILLTLEGLARIFYEPRPQSDVYDAYAHKIATPGLVVRYRVSNDVDEWVEIRTNERGMRGPSIAAAAPEGTFTLVTLGASTTQDPHHNDADTWPEILGRALEQRLGRPVRVFNAGLSGSTTWHSLARLQHAVLDLDPDLITAYHGINDLFLGLNRKFTPDRRDVTRVPQLLHKPRSYFRRWLVEDDRYPDYTTDEPYGTWIQHPDWSEGIEVNTFPSLPSYRRNLRSMAAIAEAHHTPILFITQRTAFAPDLPKALHDRLWRKASLTHPDYIDASLASLERGMKAFNQVVLSLPTSAYVHTTDAAPGISLELSNLYDDCHLTKVGNRRLAELVAPVAERILLAPPAEH